MEELLIMTESIVGDEREDAGEEAREARGVLMVAISQRLSVD